MVKIIKAPLPLTAKYPRIFLAGSIEAVCCPAGFWRKGNVDIVCKRYHVPTFSTLGRLISAACLWRAQRGGYSPKEAT